jgi:exopolysaccharide biosynthesis polyprenyl glycosylphosphotransferase
MFKNRTEGVVYLHWCALGLLTVATYRGWVAVAEAHPRLFPGVDRAYANRYLLGVVIAAFWLQRILKTVGHRLGSMRWREASRHSRHQVLRFAVVLLALAFLSRPAEASRWFLLGYLALLAGLLPLANLYIPRAIVGLLFSDVLMRTILVIKGEEVARLDELMAERRHLGIQLVGWVGRDPGVAPAVGAAPYLGAVADLPRILASSEVSQVVISQHAWPPEEGAVIARQAEKAGCRVRFFVQAQQYFPADIVSVEHEGPFTFVSLTSEPLENPVNRMLKRLLDIAVALPVVVVVLPPLTLIVQVMQWRQSPGPVLFRQWRSGHNRKRFRIYKFRTMHVANPDATVQAKKDDSRIYPFGRFLRRTSLDEFPQFLNVLAGEMSVSGPRPHLLEHDEQFAKLVNAYSVRHFVKPGITGLAQCRGLRGEILEPALLIKRVDSDVFYIRRWTLGMDLVILLQTAYQMAFPPPSAY